MIQIPSVPTDNLYKFMALVGVITFAASVLIPASVMRTITLQAFEIERDQSLLKAETKRIDALTAEQERSEHEQHMREFDRKFEDLQYRTRVASYTFDLLREWKLIASSGSLLGLVLSVAGFRLWYTRVQRFLDQALAAQAVQASVPGPAKASSVEGGPGAPIGPPPEAGE